MKHAWNIWVVGGDLRQAELAKQLAEDGHTVRTFGLTAHSGQVFPESDLTQLSKADCVIFPLPVSSSNGLLNAPALSSPPDLSSIFPLLSPNCILMGGRLDSETQKLASAHGLTIHDYYDREELAVANAVPTAEGALQLAMEHLPITIHGARVLVLGFGRVGRLTAQRFSALGAKVSIAARKYEQLAWAQAVGFGCEHLEQLSGWLCSYNLIINTVPALILTKEHLKDLAPDCLILDLASNPGGVDKHAAAELGIQLIHALALPGKVAPVSAGIILKRTVCHMLCELGL